VLADPGCARRPLARQTCRATAFGAGPVLSGSSGDRRVEIALKPGASFAEIPPRWNANI